MKHQLALVLLADRVPVGDKERGTGGSMVEGRLVNVVKKDMQRGGVTKEDTRDRVRQRQTICFSERRRRKNMSLDCGRRLEYTERTHRHREKLHTGKPQSACGFISEHFCCQMTVLHLGATGIKSKCNCKRPAFNMEILQKQTVSPEPLPASAPLCYYSQH